MLKHLEMQILRCLRVHNKTTALEKRIIQNTTVYYAKRTTCYKTRNAMYKQSMQKQQS
jgi:hypothetical protein